MEHFSLNKKLHKIKTARHSVEAVFYGRSFIMSIFSVKRLLPRIGRHFFYSCLRFVEFRINGAGKAGAAYAVGP